MKTPMLLIFLILGACYAQSDFTEVPPSQYNADPLFPPIRDYGVNFILDKALAAGKITNKASFSVININHVFTKTTSTYLYYKIDLSLTNSGNGDKLNTIFTVQYRLQNKSLFMAGYSYDVKYGSTNPNGGGNSGNYVLIPESEYATNALIQSLAEYGKDYVVARGVERGRIPAGDYEVTAIYSVEKQTVSSNADNYRFNLDFEKSDGTRAVETTFTINYRPATDRKAITGYKLTVLPFANN